MSVLDLNLLESSGFENLVAGPDITLENRVHELLYSRRFVSFCDRGIKILRPRENPRYPLSLLEDLDCYPPG